ncbi:Integrin alpha-9 [Halotydeus destructor]|nr:Integrin alpha-9 [Halotydeus destructor]
MSSEPLCLLSLIISICAVAISGQSVVDTKFPIVITANGSHSDKGEYFGFAIAATKTQNGGLDQLVIGAPKATLDINGTVFRTGSAYKCSISASSDSCKCDKQSLSLGKTNFPRDWSVDNQYVNGSFVGGAVQVSRANVIALCGHLWHYDATLYHLNKTVAYHENLPTGRCWLLSNQPQRHVIPIQIFGKARPYEKNFAQFGFSAIFDEGDNLILGGPGLDDWTGNVVKYDKGKLLSSVSSDVTPLIQGALKRRFSYTGYAMTMGNFAGTGNRLIVSAPRYKFKGRVWVFDVKNDRSIHFVEASDGQAGEYFGHSVLAVDLNGDQFDDLIVGAPMYVANKEATDQGRILVFRGSKAGLKEVTSVAGKWSRARFGTSLAAVGDVDGDGYGDIAVGAPYEAGQGVVYIYAGHKTKYVGRELQRIEAKEFNTGLASFGYSMYTEVDIDDNGTHDLLIGSYLDDKVIALRTSPAAKIDIDCKFNVSLVTLNQPCSTTGTPCFNMETCVTYEVANSRHKADDVKVDILVSIDSEFKRFYVLNGQSSDLNPQVVLKRNVKKCFSYEIVMQPRCPKFLNVHSKVKQLQIGRGCRLGSTCTSCLTLSADSSSSNILLGERKTMSLTISVVNDCEPAYQAVAEIRFADYLQLQKSVDACQEIDNNITGLTTLNCNMGDPVMRHGVVILELNTEAVPSTVASLSYQVDLTTTSEISSNSSLSAATSVVLNRQASLGITGKGKDVYFDHRSQRLDGGQVAFEIPINITKYGASPIEKVNFEVKFPAYKDGQVLCVPFVSRSFGVHVECESQVDVDLPLCPGMEDYAQEMDYLRATPPQVSRQKRESAIVAEELRQPSSNVTLNCSNAKCVTLQCTAGPFGSDRQVSSFVRLKSYLNMTNIEAKHVQDIKQIDYEVEISGNIADSLVVGKTKEHYKLQVRFITLPVPEKSALWIIIASAIVGILILLLITVCLIRIGCFKRKTKEDFKKEIIRRNQETTPYFDLQTNYSD